MKREGELETIFRPTDRVTTMPDIRTAPLEYRPSREFPGRNLGSLPIILQCLQHSKPPPPP